MKISVLMDLDLILLRKQRNRLLGILEVHKNMRDNATNVGHITGIVSILDTAIDACLDKVEPLTKVYDTGPGKTADRYTVVYTTPQGNRGGKPYYEYLGMSDNPSHPQGVGMHGELINTDWDHLGELIAFTDLPEACQVAVLNDLAEELKP